MATLLTFDTSTERLHLGLSFGAQVWVDEGDGGARASSTLMPRLRELMGHAGAVWGDLDAIAFGRGPGAFTGLRTACAVAQGLAFGLDKPALPTDTLMAVAESARIRSGAHDVWVAMDARMGEVYAARYRYLDGVWRTDVAPGLWLLDDLNACWSEVAPACVAGSALPVLGPRLEAGSAVLVPDAAPTGAALLTCAASAWAQGAACDAALALPTYLRDRVALTTAERNAARSARGV